MNKVLIEKGICSNCEQLKKCHNIEDNINGFKSMAVLGCCLWFLMFLIWQNHMTSKLNIDIYTWQFIIFWGVIGIIANGLSFIWLHEWKKHRIALKCDKYILMQIGD